MISIINVNEAKSVNKDLPIVKPKTKLLVGYSEVWLSYLVLLILKRGDSNNMVSVALQEMVF